MADDSPPRRAASRRPTADAGGAGNADDWRTAVGDGAFSPHFHAASELIGRRWTGAIVRTLFHGRSRFGEIAEAVPGLSDRLLADRLKELGAHGIVEREPEGPGYRLTEKGRDLRVILVEIAKWAERWRRREDG